MRGHGRREHHRVELGVGEQLIERVARADGKALQLALERSGESSQSQASSASGSASKLRARFGPQ